MPFMLKAAALAAALAAGAIAAIAPGMRPALIAAAAQAAPIAAGQCAPAEPWPAIPASAPANSTYEAAGKPIPARFREAPAGWVKMRFLSAAEVNRRCAGGQAICGRVFQACVRAGELLMPNPCDEPGAPAGEGYGGKLCHELAHIQGWPLTHGD